MYSHWTWRDGKELEICTAGFEFESRRVFLVRTWDSRGFYSLTWTHKVRFPVSGVSLNPKKEEVYFMYICLILISINPTILCYFSILKKFSCCSLFRANVYRGDHFRFDLVFIKKITKPKLFKKKNETEPKPVQTDQFRFGFFGQKPVQTSLARFFRFGSVFFCFFLVWFGFFGFKLKNRNRTGRFF